MRFALIVRLALLAAAAWTCAGCNTVEGMGKDIQQGGEAIQKSAK